MIRTISKCFSYFLFKFQLKMYNLGGFLMKLREKLNKFSKSRRLAYAAVWVGNYTRF